MITVVLSENKEVPAGINSFGVIDENVIGLLEEAITKIKNKDIIINQIYQ